MITIITDELNEQTLHNVFITTNNYNKQFSFNSISETFDICFLGISSVPKRYQSPQIPVFSLNQLYTFTSTISVHTPPPFGEITGSQGVRSGIRILPGKSESQTKPLDQAHIYYFDKESKPNIQFKIRAEHDISSFEQKSNQIPHDIESNPLSTKLLTLMVYILLTTQLKTL